MLEQIVKQLQNGGTTSVSALARQFNISAGLVEQMLTELVQLGYLRPLEGCSQDACTGCPQSTNCTSQRPAQAWIFESRRK